MLKNLLAVAVLGSTIIFTGCQTMPDSASTAIQANNLNLLQSQPWVLTKIGNTEIALDSARRLPTLNFDAASKRLSGSDGCNRIMGSYEAGRDTLTLGQIASTRMACPGNNQIDRSFNEALSKVTHYQAFGKTLKLTDRHGNVVLEFTSAVQPR